MNTWDLTTKSGAINVKMMIYTFWYLDPPSIHIKIGKSPKISQNHRGTLPHFDGYVDGTVGFRATTELSMTNALRRTWRKKPRHGSTPRFAFLKWGILTSTPKNHPNFNRTEFPLSSFYHVHIGKIEFPWNKPSMNFGTPAGNLLLFSPMDRVILFLCDHLLGST